ncbi:alpha/beta hydrolase [Varunaivibrio sulfuroxidans]|uniref:Palmitoyl-protein thioesterase ABHD10, mitochondrial n=1 Tax=Varunaivibrio sulfuroxidans TaxID=1773489 RepID=A0A4R3J480_9PROT|nr:alpha/beta hydrolase [Varunaivibrio sulfuroxidans]TCS60659.1 alpha/beta hydrolase family protein [Varunaivibrio sulfuroxidans]WES30150.1 alpha/beta hydrolase [Varunaivibrio sulfuroxidans]
MTETPTVSPPSIITREDGATIAYRATAGKSPCVVFLTGLHSDMDGAKALALEAFCTARGQAFVRFDYFGHGRSSGAFEDGTVGRWASDGAFVLENLTEGPLVLVGSSLGGWIILLLATRAPAAVRGRIKGLVGIAAAPDFTRDLMEKELSAAQREILLRDGVLEVPNCYDPGAPFTISLKLIEDGRGQLLLDAPIPFDGPVRLIQGMADDDVPWRTALTVQNRLTSKDVEITFVKNGDHRLSTAADLARLERTVEALLNTMG